MKAKVKILNIKYFVKFLSLVYVYRDVMAIFYVQNKPQKDDKKEPDDTKALQGTSEWKMEVKRKDGTKTKEKQPLKEEIEEKEQKKEKYVLREILDTESYNKFWRYLSF